MIGAHDSGADHGGKHSKGTVRPGKTAIRPAINSGFMNLPVWRISIPKTLPHIIRIRANSRSADSHSRHYMSVALNHLWQWLD
jgi:hypothetical protein